MTIDDPYDQDTKVYKTSPPAKRQSSTGSARGLMGDVAPPGLVQPPPEPDSQGLRMQGIQTELNAAKGIMETNILRITERGETLQHLQDRTDNLSIESQRFRSTASKTRRRMWFQNAKWTICLSIFVILILAGIIAGAIKGTQVVKERVVEHVSSMSVGVTATPTVSPSVLGATEGTKGVGTVDITPGPSPTSAAAVAS